MFLEKLIVEMTGEEFLTMLVWFSTVLLGLYAITDLISTFIIKKIKSKKKD